MNQMANEIKDNFIKGYDCSQVVFRHFAERFDLSEDEANRIAACFGGGMMLGSVCGAYTGALMAIGMKYGHTKEEGLMDQKNVMIGKYDVSTPEGLQGALDSGKMTEFCPCLAEKVIQITEEILNED